DHDRQADSRKEPGMFTQWLRGALSLALTVAGLLCAVPWTSAEERLNRDMPVEEIVVYGIAQHAPMEQAVLKAEMLARMRDLNDLLKRSIEIGIYLDSIKPDLTLALRHVELAEAGTPLPADRP